MSKPSQEKWNKKLKIALSKSKLIGDPLKYADLDAECEGMCFNCAGTGADSEGFCFVCNGTGLCEI